MTVVNRQKYEGFSASPVYFGGISKSYTGSGQTYGSTDVHLKEGCVWSHIQIYGITNGGDAGTQIAEATAYLKDGTSVLLDRYSGQNLSSPGRVTYLSNKLSQEQIANIDYIRCYAYAHGGNGSTGAKSGYSGSFVYGLKVPWVSD